MQNQRLFQILYLLLEHKTLTAQTLASRLEVSVRTILRDVDALCAAKIPLCAIPGRGGGISLMEGYALDKALFSGAEQDELLFALQSLSAVEHINTSAILPKLNALFQKNAESWLEVDFSRWGRDAEDESQFALLKNALLQSRILGFRYFNSNGESKDCTVYPLRLCFKAKTWYLKGFCVERNAFRTYRIARIQNLRLTEKSFDPAAFPLPQDVASIPTDTLVKVILRFSPRSAYRAYDEFRPSEITRHEDGSVTVTAYALPDDWFFQYLLSLESQVEVLSPPFIRQELYVRLKKMLLHYQENS